MFPHWLGLVLVEQFFRAGKLFRIQAGTVAREPYARYWDAASGVRNGWGEGTIGEAANQ